MDLLARGYLRKFEAALAEFLGVEHALAVSNGTVALHLALVTLGIGPGDEVIVPDLTFAASASAVIHAGATPVLVDVESTSWTSISTRRLRRSVRERGRSCRYTSMASPPTWMG